jgi:signal transduction histidine kinase
VQSAERVAGIVRQFLDYARRRGPQRAEYDLCRIARHSAELLRPLAEKKGVTLRVESDASVQADVDAGQIEQALTNLVMNAIHAVPPGGSVELICMRENGRPAIRIRDNGPGISARNLPRIFDPFWTTKGAGEGTGLGLSVVHDIVADHGGTIDVTSELGQGAVFTIRLA